ncbi:ABC transporter ATP-binding protein [Alteribacillus iranensis]|uniref:ABC-2 type transport system ATP-binding protein n=1 Tax=Alteribacillus iranensis TaxID=930128 RepID=A0A1I2DN45_9BACI|nr:ABC transporter ATP-binding protein [Alteribacillus iranensis]SFE81310.1 ABC-2 type transport system ATP-binding protein [Alteribacillus iranensis]
MIEVKNVKKRYLTKTAIEHITVNIPKGGITGLVGENGSGKSTFLKILAGLVRPTKGTVLVDGNVVSRRLADRIAYLSEQDTFYSFYRVKELVAFYETQFRDFNKERAEELISFMKLDLNSKIKTLSKGNRGRLKIVLTLARDAPVLLLDEPLSGLDPMVRDSIVKSLISFIDLERQTVLITTHEINEMEPLFDRVIAIKNGQILGMADSEEIRDQEGLTIVDWMKKKYE